MMMMMMMKRVFLSIVDLPDFLSDWIRLECRQRASSSFGVSGSRLNRNRRRPVDGKWRWQRKRMTISRTTASYRSTNGWNSSSFPALWWRQFSGVDHKRWTQHQNGEGGGKSDKFDGWRQCRWWKQQQEQSWEENSTHAPSTRDRRYVQKLSTWLDKKTIDLENQKKSTDKSHNSS